MLLLESLYTEQVRYQTLIDKFFFSFSKYTTCFIFSVLGSPADQVGLQPGDIITHINGKEIHDSGEFNSFLEGHEDLCIKFTRKDQIMQVTVTPES